MHCLRTIHFSKHDGFYRLVLLSFITMLFTFLLLYSIVHIYMGTEIVGDQHFLLFMGALLLLYPVHKLLHFIPLRLSGVRCRIVLKKSGRIKFKYQDPIAKVVYVGTLLFPFLVVNTICFVAILCFPEYYHYLVVLMAVHTGICVEDFIYLKHTVFAPKHSFIEEDNDGSIEVLILQ